jgi:AcrR family transcriptional regulator
VEDRKRILNAALDEFSAIGLDRSTVESIAERANVGPGVVRALFVDKERLIAAVLKETTEPLVSAIAMAIQGDKDTKERTRETFEILDDWLLENPRYVRFTQWCLLEAPQNIHKMYEQSFYPSDYFEQVEEDVSAGRLRTEDPFAVLLMLDSLIFFAHMMRPALEQLLPNKTAETFMEERRAAVMEVLEKGLFANRS